MFVNYLKVAIKVLMRRKFFTFISLFGITFTLVTLMVVASLLDSTLAPIAPEVYLDRSLACSHMAMRGDDFDWSSTPGYGFLDQYCRDLPGVELTTFFSEPQRVVSFVRGQKVVSEMRWTDAEYWNAMRFRFVEGGPFAADDEATGRRVAVIGETTRRRFLGDADAVGRNIELDGIRFQVVGVVRDVPATRMHAYADAWVPLTAAKSDRYRKTMMGGFNGIFVATSRGQFDEIRAEFQSRLQHVDNLEEPYEEMRGVLRSRLDELADELVGTNHETVTAKTDVFTWSLTVGAILFMLLPAINLVNVNISRIYERSSEIGVRKSFGASSADLVGQFVVESVFLSLIGAVIAFVLSRWVLGLVAASDVIPNADFEMNYRLFLYAVALAVLFGTVSGVYPAWKMSRLHPVDALRGGTT